MQGEDNKPQSQLSSFSTEISGFQTSRNLLWSFFHAFTALEICTAVTELALSLFKMNSFEHGLPLWHFTNKGMHPGYLKCFISSSFTFRDLWIHSQWPLYISLYLITCVSFNVVTLHKCISRTFWQWTIPATSLWICGLLFFRFTNKTVSNILLSTTCYLRKNKIYQCLSKWITRSGKKKKKIPAIIARWWF